MDSGSEETQQQDSKDDQSNIQEDAENQNKDKKLASVDKPEEEQKKTTEIQSPLALGSPANEVKKKDKINILLKPVGDAPILKQKLWAVDPDKPVSSILLFTRQYLKLENDQSLFFFVNQAFAPSPDQIIRNLYECFGSDGKLILYYSTTPAWG